MERRILAWQIKAHVRARLLAREPSRKISVRLRLTAAGPWPSTRLSLLQEQVRRRILHDRGNFYTLKSFARRDRRQVGSCSFERAGKKRRAQDDTVEGLLSSRLVPSSWADPSPSARRPRGGANPVLA